jgi:hypothetical protein
MCLDSCKTRVPTLVLLCHYFCLPQRFGHTPAGVGTLWLLLLPWSCYGLWPWPWSSFRVLPCRLCFPRVVLHLPRTATGVNQWWSACAMQVRLAHGWFGKYYACLGIPEDSECSCTAWQTAAGEPNITPIVQTQAHILLECPSFAAACAHHFFDPILGKLWLLWVILSSRAGNIALCEFLKETNMFFKQRPPAAPDPPSGT